LLPEWLLNYSVYGVTVVPHFLGPGDHPWLRALLEEFDRAAGRPERDLDARLRDVLAAPLHPACPEPGDGGRRPPYLGGVPARKLRLAVHVLRRGARAAGSGGPGARRARAALFVAAAAPGARLTLGDGVTGGAVTGGAVIGGAVTGGAVTGGAVTGGAVIGGAATGAAAAGRRAALVAVVARSLGLGPAGLEEALLDDIPRERRLGAPWPPLGPDEVAHRANLLLAQGLLARAAAVSIQLQGQARAVVLHAKRRGLICTVTRSREADDARLDLSGPFALFRRTLVYGRALGELLPLLQWCRRYRLEAECLLQGQRLRLVLGPGDLLAPAAEPRRYDSRLEERFAADFRRLAPDWEAIREPEPVAAGETLVFPDFALQHRRDPARRWLLEVAGFWTPAYVERKLASLRAAGRQDLILCLDEERNCAADALPAAAPVLRFRRRVDAAAVLALIEGRAAPAPPGPGAPTAPAPAAPTAAPTAPGPRPVARVYRLAPAPSVVGQDCAGRKAVVP
jgi:hypothetical protein